MRRRTKIIATLGPSSENLISSLKDKVDIFRVNLAHGDTESHSKYFELIKTQAPTSSILVDLPGPKLRVGDIGKVELRAGQEILFFP